MLGVNRRGSRTTHRGDIRRRRELDAALVYPAPGPASAGNFLASNLGLSVHLIRARMLGWGIAVVLLAALYGSFTQQMVDAAGTLPEELSALFPPNDMREAYLSFIAVFTGLFTAAGEVFAESLVAQTQQLAPVVATIGVVVVLFDWVPAATATVSWAVLGFSFAMTTFWATAELSRLDGPAQSIRAASRVSGRACGNDADCRADRSLYCRCGVGAWGFRRRAIQASVFSLGGQMPRVSW